MAEEISAPRCSCKNLNSIFLSAIERDIPHWGAPGSPELEELRSHLKTLTANCGFERDSEGHWIQWPKQDAVLEKMGPFTIVKEHDDGDLTLDTKDGKVVVTTDGEVFYEKEI